MSTYWGRLFLGLGITPLYAIAMAGSAIAQSNIVPDNTLLSENSMVIPNFNGLPFEVIDGGAQRGQNLFHSFGEFNVGVGRGAYFFSPSANIQNILARVTGSNRSEILGVLGTFGNSNPNLFLINPNGIIFGTDARLDVGGSFVSTTANAIGFGELGFFSASSPNVPSPLLSVNPSALFFNRIPTGSIENRSAVAAGVSLSGLLQVPNGRSLLLVGGDVSVDGGVLNALGGRIELSGLTEPGTVGLSLNGNDLRLSYPEGVARADVSVTNQGFINVIADNGGSIAINARNVNLAGESFLRAGIDFGLGTVNSQAGDIDINATNAVTLSGGSLIFNLLNAGAVGNSGDINITTGSLSLTTGAGVSAFSNGRGNTGNVRIRASGFVLLDGQSEAVGVLNTVGNLGVGDGGDIDIQARSLSLISGNNFTFLNTPHSGVGNAGNIRIQASDTVRLNGFGGVQSLLGTGGTGSGGNIEITTREFSATNSALVSSSTLGRGNAGNINIQASDVRFDAFGGVQSAVSADAIGNGGNIEIRTQLLSVTNGSLNSSSLGQGNAGNITIQATGSVRFDAFGRAEATVISGAVGDGGNIEITTPSLSLTNDAVLISSTDGQGNAGNIQINAANGSVSITNFSGLSTATFSGSGQGGSITVDTGAFQISDGAFLFSSTFGSGSGGNISITADTVSLNDAALFTSSDGQGDAGNIQINAANGSVSIANNSLFSTLTASGSGRGGAITVDTGAFQISDDAFLNSGTNASGTGGNINVTANSFEAVGGGALSSRSLGSGAAGDITVNVKDQFILTGSLSGLFANATSESTANSGNIFLNARTATIQEDARISANNQGTGIGGSIQINADVLRLDNRGQISATTASNQGGNITLRLSDLLLLRRGSTISTSAGSAGLGGDGGIISINAPFVVSVPLENSDITANAFNGSGGRIIIDTNSIFGLETRSREDVVNQLRTDDPSQLDPRQLQTNDITAFSQQNPSLSGQITINTPDVDSNRGLVELPTVTVDVPGLVASNCAAFSDEGGSSFTVTGRGGLPPSPDEPLSSDVMWSDTRIPVTTAQQHEIKTAIQPPSKPEATPIVPATGWVSNKKGEVTLISHPTNATVESNSATCSRQ